MAFDKTRSLGHVHCGILGEQGLDLVYQSRRGIVGSGRGLDNLQEEVWPNMLMVLNSDMSLSVFDGHHHVGVQDQSPGQLFS